MQKVHEIELEILGKTLNLGSSPLQRGLHAPQTVMFSLVAQVARLFRFNTLETPSSPAATLMESADSRAGLDARHAQELRAAASAWLSVVR